MQTVFVKRPVAFRLRRAEGDVLSKTEWRYFTDEEAAWQESLATGQDYQAPYVRDGSAITEIKSEGEILEAAIDRMGWSEIHAFEAELRKGQDIREDAGGYMMRAIRRLFGLPTTLDEVTTYKKAAEALIKTAVSEQS